MLGGVREDKQRERELACSSSVDPADGRWRRELGRDLGVLGDRQVNLLDADPDYCEFSYSSTPAECEEYANAPIVPAISMPGWIAAAYAPRSRGAGRARAVAAGAATPLHPARVRGTPPLPLSPAPWACAQARRVAAGK
jgi:hypothetical protein